MAGDLPHLRQGFGRLSPFFRHKYDEAVMRSTKRWRLPQTICATRRSCSPRAFEPLFSLYLVPAKYDNRVCLLARQHARVRGGVGSETKEKLQQTSRKAKRAVKIQEEDRGKVPL